MQQYWFKNYDSYLPHVHPSLPVLDSTELVHTDKYLAREAAIGIKGFHRKQSKPSPAGFDYL